MKSPDKKYIVVDEKSGQTFRFGADQWETDQHDFMADYPGATIIEYDSYTPENLKDNDTVFVNTEDGTYSFTADEWKNDEESFRKNFKKVEPSIARGVDYYLNQALDLESQIEQKKQSIADWEQRNSAEREKRLQWNPDTPAVPFIEDMQAAHKETEIEAEGNTLYNELDDLERRFYANPRVSEAMEENKRLREEAQRKYVADLQTEAEGMLAEAGEDVATEKLRTHETMMNALDGQYGSLFSAKGPSGETKEQVREYNKAGAALTMLQHAKDIREGKADGFFEGMGNVVKKDIKELMYQSESESFVQVALLLKRLNDEIGSLDNLTSEDIDKHLNKEEALLLRSYFELMSAQKEARVNWKDNWKYTAGEIAGESIKFALEFAAIGGLADDVAKGATKGLTLAMEQWIDRGLQKGSKALLRKGVAWTADLLLRGGIKSAIVTAMRPSTYATIAQHLPEQDEEGNIRLGRNALIGALDAGIETISEMSGDLISKGLGVVMKPIGKGLGKVGKGVATKMFGEAVQNVKFNKWSVFFGGVLPDYVKAAGFHGIVPEMLEEVVGNAMRLSYGDDSLYEMFKDGNGRAMLLGFIPMTIFGGAASVAQFRAVDERAAKIGERLGNFLASKGYEQGRIEALTERRTDKSPLELDVQMRLLSEELKKNGATEEELKLVDEYAMAVAEFQTLRGITEMREKQDLQEENRALTQQYGKVDVNGQVTTAETKDGRTVFLVSERDVNGQYAAVDQQTGKQSFITDADIASVKDEKGNDIAKRQSVPLNTYLGERLNQRNRLKEAERMLKEKSEQITRLNELMPEKLNLGTETEPVMVAVKSRDAKGVVVVDENGNEQPLSWEAVGRVMGLPIRVFTDEEISELEQKEIALEREARRAARAEAYAENEEVAKEVDEISEKLKKGITRPEAAYIDEKTGKVDETSFWENDPEGYCEWNDREHKGDPTDSLDQIQNSLDKLYEKQKGLEKTKSDDPVERKAVNEEKARLQERIGKLEGIKMGYVQKALQKVKETAEDMLAKEEERGDLVIAMRERINAWRERFNLDESKLAVYESVDEVADPEVKKMIMRGDYVPGWNTGKHAFIYLPQIDSVETLDKTVMHEVVTHYGFRALFPNTKEGQEEFNKLMDKVWNMMSDASRRHFSFYANIASKEGDERRRAAAEEFVAHVGENVVMDKATTEEKSFWKRFVEFFTSLFDKMQTKLTGVDVAEIVRNNYNRLAQQVDAQQRQAEAQQEQAVEEAVAEAPAPVESITDIADAAQQDPDAINLAPTDDTKHSYKTENYLADQIRGYAKSREGKKAGWTKETLEEVIAETESLITAIHNSSTGNEFYDEFASKDPTIRMDWRDGQLKPIVTWTRANIEYKYDMSADLLCVNNEGLEEVLSSEQMVALMPLFNTSKKDEVTIKDMKGKEKTAKVEIGFSQDDYLELYTTLKDLGFVVPCKGCFDAAGRFKMLPSVAYKFAAAVNAVIDERNADPEAFDAALKKKAGKTATIDGLPTSAKTKLDAIRAGVAGDNLTEHVKWTQLMSADGQTKMLSDWGGIFRAWQRTGAGRPKDKLLPEPYYGDIVSQQTTIIGKYGEKTPSFKDILVNTGTGLRRNSHSEFRPVLAVDEIQFMRDAFIKNLTVFKYMKELDDVRLFGNLGVKFNMSFFPEFVEGTKAAGLDLNGDYIPSEESVGAREFPYIGEDGKKHYDGRKGWEEAQKHINKDVSLSSVILSIPHLIKAMTDVPTTFDKSGIWGSLIPFHSSGATSLALFLQGLGKARANGVGHGFEEAFTRYGEGVTNFEAVQNDRFGKGWVILEGKKAGEAVEEGHKLEFVNGTHYYNSEMGLHLFASTYVFDGELPEGAMNEDGTLNLSAAEIKKIGHAYEIDYNNKVREIGTPTAYAEAADYYLQFLPTIGLKPRFDFDVPEEIFLQMCEDANVDPMHPKLGWKGAGNAWNPIHSAAYYSLFCDYGMTDPATGEWAPHNPVGYVNENGEREFRMPENTVEIVKEGLDRYSNIRRSESAKIDEAINEFARRSVEKGRISQEAVDSVLGKENTMFKTENIGDAEVTNLVLDSSKMDLPKTRDEAIAAIPKSGKICKAADGEEIRVSRRSVRHSVLHNNKSSYALFGVIDDVVANSVKIGEIPIAEDEIGKTNSVSVYYVPVNINGTQYSARIIVKETIHNEKILDTLSLYNVALHTEKTPSNTNVGESEETRVYSDSVKSAYKVKEIIHNSQAEDKKLVGIENETTFFKTAPRTDEQRAALFNAAKEEFGVTNNFGVAGYMLPDGALLDFSEVKDGGPANVRTRDHREIGGIMEDREYDTRTEYITDFLNEGAVRIMPESDAINLSVAPSEEQRKKLLDYFYKKDGYIILELDNPEGKSVAYVEYDKKTSPYRIMRDIDGYFNEGIVPEQTTMFKTRRPDQSAMSFAQQSMRDYVRKYGNATYIEVMPVNDDTARKLGYTLEELELMGGVYGGKEGIAIFAREKNTDSDQIETTIYHESVHHLHNIYPELDELAEYLWDNADDIGVLGKIKKNILAKIKGDEDNKKIEMLAFSMEYYAGRGEIDDLIEMVPDEGAKRLIEFITNKTKYGRSETVREDSERGEAGRDTDGQTREQGEGSGNAEGENGEGTLFKTAINPEVRKEMDQIAAQAIVDGNYLKAPNGKDTKLTPEQWALVRTKNFKEWFGDWENDPENASKVVDENGEPKVVYHQTNSVVYINRETGENWDELDWRARQEWDERDDWDEYWEEQDFNTFSRVNARTTNELDGFFFAPEYDEYHEYGDRTIPAFLNITNPASREDYNIDSSINNAGREERIRLQNEGFDGVIREEDGMIWEYVAFEPNQIKSATDNTGEYSEDEDIRFKTYAKKDLNDSNIATALSELYDDFEHMENDIYGTEELVSWIGSILGNYDGKYVADLQDIIDTYEEDNREFGRDFNEYGGRMVNTEDRDAKVSSALSSLIATINEPETKESKKPSKTGVLSDATRKEISEKANNLLEEYTKLRKEAIEQYGKYYEFDAPKEVVQRINKAWAAYSLVAMQLTFPHLYKGEEGGTFFKTRTTPAPTKTQEVYKLMRLGADGKLYPLFIGSAEPIELGTWYDAESPNLGDLTKLASGVHLVNNETGEAVTLDEFKAQHPEIAIKGKRPNVAAINWATENGARWIEIEDKATAQRRYEGESRSYYNLGINGSGQVGQFAMRPGWHAGSLPTMRQIGKGKDKNLRDDSFVWVKGRIPADVDYQSEADANPDKDIPTHIPTDGFYMKATNANAKASQADKMGWYVAGSFIADEIMSDAEARSVIDSWNAEHPDAEVEYDYPRESGREFDPARGGLVESDTMFKTSKNTSDIDVDELVNTGRQKVNAERKIAADARMDKLRAVNDALAELNRIVTLDETAEADAIIDMARKLATSNDTSYRLKLALDPLITAAESATADAEREDAVENLKRLLIDNNVKEAAFAQREYDEKTVKSIAQQAKELLEVGALADMTRGEIKRLIGAITSATGKRNLTKSVNRLMDVMIANQLRMGRENIDKFLKVRGKKVDARGVEVQGKLDIEGQQIMDAVRENIGNDLVDILFRMVDVEEKLSDPSETVRRNAENELAGLELAKQYVETIKESKKEEKKLRKEVKDAEEEYKQGRLDRKAFRDFVKTVDQAIRENRIERVKAYQALAESFAKMMTRSIENAGQLREAEKRRIQRIQHFANSDMQGMPSNEHGSVDSKWLNNPVVRFFLKPLATFDQMLRQFGSKSVNGEGYLWNHFMRGWLKATEAEYKGVQAAHNELDAKAQELFGRDGVKKWSDIFEIDRKLPGATLSWWDGGEMKDHEITQGNMLYIYMVNKMTDGKMKLRKMGIDESDVARLVDNMDPRFVEAADWIQDVFLPDLRDKYNAVHERLFGAPMAAIDSYFPIRVLANARVREVDLGVAEGNAKPSTMTGSIIKRTRNSLALDILGSNAFDVVLEHIQQMEHWAAFAEFNRDLNTLLSYRLFRNRVQNMSGIYGAGKEVWNNFRSVAEMAAGVYEPASKSDSIDKTAMNLAKGVTAAKISFRVYTAIKQLLSMPAFISDASAVNLAKTLANPKGAWEWAMENLPLFEKRWKSRQAGDSRLMQTESDWKIWKDKVVELAGRYGMSPNAFVDAITVAIGAKSIYETKKSKYLKYGYPEAEADEKAKQDATILFNESQQSNESAFLSTMQVDRTVASVAFSLFRNSSMGYERMFVDSLRNIKHLLTKGYKAESIEFMRKQFVRDGLTEDQAERAAERAYGKSLFSAAMRAVTFGFVVQFAWNLGGYLPYLIAGDDDDEKKDMIKDAARHALIGGPVEGLTGGSIISEAGNMIAKGDDFKNYSPTLLPVVSDFKKVLQMFAYDEVAAVNEVFNILVQAGVGVNPQTFTDIGVAIYDACNGDLETMKEATLCLLRILQIPQSQADKVYIDEIDFTADKGLELTVQEFAERYADYKVRRGAPVTGWMYSDEKQKEREEKYIARFKKMAEEYKRTRGNEEAKAYYEYLDNEYKEVSTTLADLKSKMKAEEMKGNEMGALEFAEMLDDYMKSDVFQRYSQFGGKAKAIEKIRDMLLKVDERTMDLMEDVMLQLRKEMVEEMEQAKAETDAND